MRLIHYDIDDSFYPISRRKVYKIFGVSIWSISYILTPIGGMNFAWVSESGLILTHE